MQQPATIRRRKPWSLALAAALIATVFATTTPAHAWPITYECYEQFNEVAVESAVPPGSGDSPAAKARSADRSRQATTRTSSVAQPDPGVLPAPTTNFELELTEGEAAFGTGAIELSGAAFDQERETVLLLDNTNVQRIHEFATENCDHHAVGPVIRTVTLQGLGGDIEGVVWIAPESWAVVDENTGTIRVFTVPDGSTDLTITLADVTHTVETGIDENSGKGAEGLAFDAATESFLVADEGPTVLHRFSWDGAEMGAIAVPMSDLSGLHFGDDGVIWIASHEDALVTAYEIDSAFTTLTEILSIDASEATLNQVEGVALSPDLKHLHVVSETENLSGNSYGFWTS